MLNRRSGPRNSRSHRRRMRRQLRAHQHNNHPRAGQLNPAHQHRAFLVNHRRVLLVNRRVSRVNHRLALQELHLPEPLQERP